MTLWSHGLVRSRDNLKPLYLQYHSVYGYHTWWAGDLAWGSFTRYLTLWLRGLWGSRDNLKLLYLHNRNIYGHKTWEHGAFLACLTYIKSNYHRITWSFKITWPAKIIIYLLTKCLWLPILAGWDAKWGVPFHKTSNTLITWSWKVT